MTHQENTLEQNPHVLCIAPMLDWTDRHQRFFMRLISPHARVYTEMITTGAIIHGDSERFLSFSQEEHPIALQIGGSDPEDIAKACKIADQYNYDEINLNIGCPSDRVQSGRFGACLMADPERVRDCVAAMIESSTAQVTVKCRTGIDELDSYEFLVNFIETVSSTGCSTFIIHARKAWLSGLSPKENREIPPLHYEKVYQIKKDFESLSIILNGGITSAEQVQEALQHSDGVMIGREAYQNPYFLAQCESIIFNNHDLPSRHDVLRQMLPYIENQLANGYKLNHITRHILGIFNSQPKAKVFRRYLSENAHKPDSGIEVLEHAISLVPET